MSLTGVHVADGSGDASGGATGVKPGALTALLQEVAAAPERREEEPLSLPPGTVVGRFEIIRELGRGGFGVVYEAKDRDLGRQVAVKVVRPGRVTEVEGKVSREAEAIARLSHPNLITLHEVGRSEHGPFLVFEFLRGKTLQERMDDGPMPVQEAVHVATEVARGLAHAHAEGVIHRDLKPANVFVTTKGQVKILDFGMAHAFGRRRLSGGTPAYMAPEQWEDAPEDERTDVFALGVMLYRMLSGEYPFPEGQGKCAAEGGVPRKLDVPGSPELAELVEKMLNLVPTQRPRDGAAVLAALTPIEGKLRARPAEGRPPEHARRRKATFGDLLAELKRRHVFRVMVGYGIFSFAVLQVIEPIMHGAELPDWVLKAALVALALGFPVAVILAWVYDLTAQGVKRTSSASGPGAPSFGHARFLLPLAVSVAVLAIAAAGAGGWYAWNRAREHRSASALPGAAPSIAVLPFTDMSPGKDQEYLSDGIAEEILSALSRVQGLRVAGRTSSFYFKGRNVKLADIGRELNVGAVLEGGVRRDGNRIRVTATIVNTADGFHVWSETWDRDLKDILVVENEIAKEVVEALKIRLLGGGRPTLPEPPRTTAEAHLHVLKGRQAIQRGSAADWANAIREFETALKVDPNLSSAWAGLAMALDADAEERRTTEALVAQKLRALEAANKAVATGPDVPDAYLERAYLRGLYRLEWMEALADIEKAISLGGARDSYAPRARLLAMQGRLPEAMSDIEKCVGLEPMSTFCIMRIGLLANGMGQFARGQTAFRRVLEIAPDHSAAAGYLAQSLILDGRPQDALAEAARSRGHEAFRIQAVALGQHALGHPRESQEAFDDLSARFGHNAAFQIAEVCAWRGDVDGAFWWLDRAAERFDSGMAMVTYSPFLRSVRGDRRYAALLRKMNLPVTGEGAQVPAASVTAIPSIAVLPFADMSPKHDQEYFADGVAEEILNGLARVGGLKVIGRTSSFSFKGKSDDIKTIGQKLGVANVLEGSLRKSGGRLRITAQLVKAADGVHLWSQTFDRPAADVFAVQDEIARAVVEALKVRLLVPGGTVMPTRPTESLEAYNQYLLGLGFVRRDSEQDLRLAEDAFRRAIRADQSFAPAWAGLAWVLWALSEEAQDPAAMAPLMREAMAAAEKAVVLGPERPEGYLSRGQIRKAAHLDWIGARSDLEKALELNPGDARSLAFMAGLRLNTEGPAAALPGILRAAKIDPLYAGAHQALCSAYGIAGAFDEALRACERVLELTPNSSIGLYRLADVLLLQGSPAKSLEILDRIPEGAYLRLTGEALAQFSLGNRRASDEALAALVARWGHIAAYQIAQVYAWRGEKDRAFEWLERGIAQHDGGLTRTKFDPLLRSLHGDPRLDALLKKLNFPVN